ncbi:MAG: N,N-dimethylformamidase beta subunit family domain-containing protein [Acidimicrobiales bacterium]
MTRRGFLRATGAGLGLVAFGAGAWDLGEQVGPGRGSRSSLGRDPGGAAPRTRAASQRSDAVRTVMLDSGVPVPSADWVVAENQVPGTLDWVMGARSRIYGYSDHVSAVAGDVVTLFIDPPATAYRVELYRMGYYQGLGGRLMWTSATLAGGGSQPPPTVAPGTNMVECQWQPTTRVAIDDSWPPGAYLFKLTNASGTSAGYIPLCVRDDTSTAAFAIMHSVTTWQAYNAYGGRSLYVGPGTVRIGETGTLNRSRVVSFDRPYDQRGWGAPDFTGNEYPLIFLAERLGLDVTYFTDVDLHERPARLAGHRCLFSLGHDEYWSSAMRDGATQAVAGGLNIAFLGANAVYRHIRLEPSPLGQNRHQVCYKSDLAKEDPLWGVDPAEVTSNWPDGPVPRPEQQLVGSQYADVGADAPMVIADAGSWVFAGTGVASGTHLPHVIVGEYDHYEPGLGGPADVRILAHSPIPNRGPGSVSDMTYYTAPGGGGVLATGSAMFVCRLSNAPRIDPNIIFMPIPGVTPVLWRMMENVFSVFGAGPASSTQPSVANWRQFA